MPYRVLVIGPDPIRSPELCTFIHRIESLKLVAIVAERTDALPLLMESRIDLLVLDLHSEERNVLLFLEELSDPPQVIITTDFEIHALEGFDHGIVDLLLRPFTFDRFQLAIERAGSAMGGTTHYTSSAAGDRGIDPSIISIRSGRRSHYIQVDSIRLIEAVGNHVRLQLHDREVQANSTMKQMEELLPEIGFTRVHRSYIVADRIVLDLDNETLFTQLGEVPIGAAYRKNVKNSFSSLRTIG